MFWKKIKSQERKKQIFNFAKKINEEQMNK